MTNTYQRIGKLVLCIKRAFAPEPRPTVSDDYLAKRREWMSALYGDDAHAIKHQLWEMLERSATFDLVVWAFQQVPTNVHGEPRINPLVYNLIRLSYRDSQVIMLRRLIDPDPQNVSLRALLVDMKRHKHLFNRENILTGDEESYDEAGIDESERVIWRNKKEGMIDLLAGVGPEYRSASDQIRPSLFEGLQSKIATMDQIRVWVNHYVAHATPVLARQELQTNIASLDQTLHLKLEEAQRTLCELTSFLLSILGTQSIAFLPITLGNTFQYLDEALVSTGNLGDAQRRWESYSERYAEYHAWNWQALVK